ncbi:glycosyltransferase family 4 protein [Candidatus Sumerlaeota bacterium]|nr:glycosyltransferase family 4 protein [Candidatus Sumerlaeota bacterium]
MKTVGIVSFFPAFSPPRSGGELRLHHIATHLALRGFDVQMASPTHNDAPQEVIEHAPHFVERRFPKTRVYSAMHRTMDRVAGFQECSGLVCSLVARRHAALRAEAERLARESRIYTQESPFLAPLIPRRRRHDQLFVYNSYNNEARLAREMFGRSLQGRIATRRIRSLEKYLLRESDIVLACSEEDAESFVSDFGVDHSKITVVPNGVDVEAIRPCASPECRAEAREHLALSANRPACFFIGSFHPPNIDAVDTIIHRLAPEFPEADFLIAGRVCDTFRDKRVPENVRLLGLADEATKLALLHGTDVALNPIRRGSGTNLKMLEYFAAGQAVLTTHTGARGLGVENRFHALVTKDDDLVAGLEELLADESLRHNLGREARLLVEEKFSWHRIGETVAELYTLKSGRRLIILNDYSVIPSEQGGQVRVEAVARRLSSAGMNVSILTLSATKPGRRLQVNQSLEELNVPRTDMHRRVDALLSHFVGCGADDVSALLLTKVLTPQFSRVLRREARFADGIMLSHPYMEPMTRGLGQRKKIYYDSHNTEFELKKALYKPSTLSDYLVRRIRQTEIDACSRSVATFCVSDENRARLSQLVPRLESHSYVAPNGVDCSRVHVRGIEERRRLRREIGFGREFIATFLGSGHPPNAEAARLIIHQIAREHPRVLFLLVGSVSGWFWNTPLPGNVLLMGMVSTPVKNFLLQISDFALNPMLTGSGTSLKLFDYMAAGLPVLSTAIGARGLDEEAMKGVILLEPDDFSSELRALLGDPQRCARLSANARRIAEQQFDWSVTLQSMAEKIASGEKNVRAAT